MSSSAPEGTTPSAPVTPAGRRFVGRLRQRMALATIQRGRRRLARAVLRGRGVEIGALHSPFPLPPGAAAVYVDRMPAAQLRLHYAERGDSPLVPVDVVDAPRPWPPSPPHRRTS